VRREPGAVTKVSWISEQSDLDFLASQRDAQKLLAFTSARSEAFFARRVLLVEGPGDVLAVRMRAERDAIDLDAEDFAVIDCGSKSAIPFMARACRALGIPVVALHDEDIYEAEDGTDERAKTQEQNAAEGATNKAVVEAVGDSSRVFIIAPSLEEALGISQNAKDKPRRVVQALTAIPAEQWPNELAEAVELLCAP
jgi:putative ATP-dependent endonuclease of the OLD family